jgi:hypothetical protein
MRDPHDNNFYHVYNNIQLSTGKRKLRYAFTMIDDDIETMFGREAWGNATSIDPGKWDFIEINAEMDQ